MRTFTISSATTTWTIFSALSGRDSTSKELKLKLSKILVMKKNNILTKVNVVQ